MVFESNLGMNICAFFRLFLSHTHEQTSTTGNNNLIL